MSERGNYCLAVIKVKEEYDALHECLSDISREKQEFKKIEFDGGDVQTKVFSWGGLEVFSLCLRNWCC